MPTNSITHGLAFGHGLRHAHAQPAVHQVLFGHHDGAGFRRRAADRVAVQRLHGVHIDHPRRHALRFQDVRRQQCLCHQQAVGDQGDVRARRHFDRLADLELLIRSVDHRRLGPPGADEHRPIVGRRGAHQRLGGCLVGRRDHHKSRQRTRQADLFNAHLRRPVVADRDAAVRSHHLQVRASVGRADAQLLEALVHHEHAEAGDKRNLSGHGQAGSHAHHVRFGDAAGEEAIGKFLRKIRGHGGFRKIGIHHHYVFVLAPQFHQRAPEGFARGGAQLDFKFRLCLGRHG